MTDAEFLLNTLQALLDEGKRDEGPIHTLVENLIRIGEYPPDFHKATRRALNYGARWHKWAGVTTCPHCGADLRNLKAGPPFLRTLAVVCNDRTSSYICPDCGRCVCENVEPTCYVGGVDPSFLFHYADAHWHAWAGSTVTLAAKAALSRGHHKKAQGILESFHDYRTHENLLLALWVGHSPPDKFPCFKVTAESPVFVSASPEDVAAFVALADESGGLLKHTASVTRSPT